MTPMQLWIDGLEKRYWSVRGRLRALMDDPQICGYGYCAIGVLCDLFLEHAPEEAARAKAHWDEQSFVWEEDGSGWGPSRVTKKVWAEIEVPAPVAAWWKKHHALDLGGVIAFNDVQRRSFREFAMYLRGVMGMSYLVTK